MDKGRLLKYNGALLAVAMIWGLGFNLSKMAFAGNMSVSLMLCIRFVSAALLIFVIFHKKLLRFTFFELKQGMLVGGLLFAGFILQTKALEYTTPSKAAFLTSLMVIIVPFINWAVNRTKPTKLIFLAALLSLIGILLLTVDTTQGFTLETGDILSILCAFAFAAYVCYLYHAVKQVDETKINFLQLAFTALFSVIWLLIFDMKNITVVNYSIALPPVLIQGVFNTALAYYIQTKAQKVVNPSACIIILSLESLFCVVFSVLMGYESLNSAIIWGGAFMLLSVLLVNIKTNKLNKEIPANEETA